MKNNTELLSLKWAANRRTLLANIVGEHVREHVRTVCDLSRTLDEQRNNFHLDAIQFFEAIHLTTLAMLANMFVIAANQDEHVRVQKCWPTFTNFFVNVGEHFSFFFFLPWCWPTCSWPPQTRTNMFAIMFANNVHQQCSTVCGPVFLKTHLRSLYLMSYV